MASNLSNDRRSFKETRELERELYLALGHSISAWARVESNLCSLYSRCMDMENQRFGNLGFWAVRSFDAKLKMSDAVISEYVKMDREHAQSWKSIFQTLNSANRKRNKLAHSTVVNLSWTTNSGTRKADTFLSPFHYDNRKIHSLEERASPRWDPRPKDRLYATDINAFRQDFYRVGEHLMLLSAQLFDEWLD